MKLELKHLAPYFSYGLKCEILNYQYDYVGEKYGTINGYYVISNDPYYTFKDRSTSGKDSILIRPLLRPLSQLAEPIKTDVGFICICEIFGLVANKANQKFLETKISNKWISYKEMEILFEYHFDVFGLIENNLAIPIDN